MSGKLTGIMRRQLTRSSNNITVPIHFPCWTLSFPNMAELKGRPIYRSIDPLRQDHQEIIWNAWDRLTGISCMSQKKSMWNWKGMECDVLYLAWREFPNCERLEYCFGYEMPSWKKRVCLLGALVKYALHCPVAKWVTGALRKLSTTVQFVIPVIISIISITFSDHPLNIAQNRT